MEKARELVASLGHQWNLDVNTQMESAFNAIHNSLKGKEVDNVQIKKDVKYGAHDRQRLDIYYPEHAADSSNLPVVAYIHGGAFVAGDTDISEHLHGNIARYFAKNGCIGVLVTYRLLPEARYPDGAEDISSAMAWLASNVGQFGGDHANIFAVAQSAGGAHLATAVFCGMLKTSVKGCVYQSAPWWYDLRQERRKKNMLLYHGTDSEEEVMQKTSLAAFEAASPDVVSGQLMMLMVGEFDPNEIVEGNMRVVQEFRKKTGHMPVFEVMEGENHISYALGVGIEGSEVGPRILRWIKKHSGATA